MTATLDTGAAQSAAPRPARAPDRPQLKAVIARVAATLATAVVAPAALFAVTLVIFGIPAAVSVALAWIVAAMCWRWATRRPVSGVLVLTLGILTIKTGFTLLTGNTFVYFVQPVVADGVVAAIFLGSLCTARPVVSRLAADFYPIDAATAERPRLLQLFRRLTLLWGLVIVVKGVVTLWLLVSLPTVSFVVIKSGAILTLTLTAVAATIAMSAAVGRQEGLLTPSARVAMRRTPTPAHVEPGST
jgi:intracellular septation protein A